MPMTEIRTILFASDLSPESDRTFAHATFLAERFGARLTLYHALEMQGMHAPGQGTDPASLTRWEKTVRQQLGRRASKLTVEHEIVVQGGLVGGHVLVDLALLDVIHRTRPDLTVMATQGRKGFARFFLGSVTEQVVQHARRPVLCVRKATHDPALPYRRIVVPTDFSAASRRAFSVAALLARSFEARVTALHVCAAQTQGTLGVPAALPTALTEEDVRRFLQPEFSDVRVDARVCAAGAPWHRIVKTAEEEEADLVVMSTQGLDSLSDTIIGSNAERVLRHASCPVLVA
jgi:nucleotide-binding universal stress UspA family protein